jgi:inner membrane protein
MTFCLFTLRHKVSKNNAHSLCSTKQIRLKVIKESSMKFAMALKLLVIGIVTIVISVALYMVNSTISDRQSYRDEAVKSIESSYAGPQELIGPVLVRPYTEITYTMEDQGKGVTKRVEHTADLNALSFPRILDLRGTITPNERRHGLYTVEVFKLAAHLKGSIEVAPPQTFGTIVWGEPYLAMSVQDVRGFIGTPSVTVNGHPETMVHGANAVTAWTPNLHIPLRNITPSENHLDFNIDMTLAGTERLSFAPIADSNHIELTSTWHSPLFDGQFLPHDRKVDASGFTAAWDVPSLATSAQLQLLSTESKPVDLLNVSLLTPIDPYKLSDRATKYGILFVLLTFSGFFLFEMLKQLPIHPIQYLLVGFGLVIFFLLLISFSEHMPFALAYTLSSSACIGLLTFYLTYVLRSFLRGVGFGTMLITLYAAVYGLLISEDNALILGSLLLFAVLSVVMVVTRKVDWYRLSAKPTIPPIPSPFSLEL